MEEDINIFKEYRELIDLIKTLEEKKDALQLKVIDAIDMEGGREVKTKWGSFYSHGRKSWEYSPAIASMQKTILDAKHEEEANGTATLVKVTSYVRLVIPKE